MKGAGIQKGIILLIGVISIGIAVYLPVSSVSIFRLRMSSLLSRGLVTHSAQTRWIYVKRISAMAALRSSPRSFSICITICSIIFSSF